MKKYIVVDNDNELMEFLGNQMGKDGQFCYYRKGILPTYTKAKAKNLIRLTGVNRNNHGHPFNAEDYKLIELK